MFTFCRCLCLIGSLAHTAYSLHIEQPCDRSPTTSPRPCRFTHRECKTLSVAYLHPERCSPAQCQQPYQGLPEGPSVPGWSLHRYVQGSHSNEGHSLECSFVALSGGGGARSVPSTKVPAQQVESPPPHVGQSEIGARLLQGNQSLHRDKDYDMLEGTDRAPCMPPLEHGARFLAVARHSQNSAECPDGPLTVENGWVGAGPSHSGGAPGPSRKCNCCNPGSSATTYIQQGYWFGYWL